MITRSLRKLSLVAAALALAGCVNLAPDHVRPALSTDAEYNPAHQPDGSVVASSLGWRDYFEDARLEALIATALDNNRDLMAATARIAQARARYRIEDSRRLPTPVANAGATRSRVPITATDASGPSAAITSNRFDVGVGVSAFEIDFWGRVANMSEAARAQYLSTVAAQRAFYLSLIGDVASTYYELLETEDQIALAEATATSRREGLRLAELRLDAGITSALSHRQAESLLTQAEQQVAIERLNAAQLENRLTVLVGGRMPEDLPDGIAFDDRPDLPALDADLPSELLLARPDIIAAEETLRAARANIGAARAAFFPTISLTGNAGFASDSLGSLFSGNPLSWSFGPSASLPIFDWGAREADLDLARAQEAEAVATYDLTVQNAFREVSDGLAGRRWLAEQVAALKRGVDANDRIAELARLRYREGVTNFLEVLDAERNLFAARQSLLTTRRAQLQNLVNLYIALGGGGQPRTD